MRTFVFEPPDFFADFVAVFLPTSWGKECPEKSFKNISDKIMKIYTTDSPTHVCRGAGPTLFPFNEFVLKTSSGLSKAPDSGSPRPGRSLRAQILKGSTKIPRTLGPQNPKKKVSMRVRKVREVKRRKTKKNEKKRKKMGKLMGPKKHQPH